MTAWHEKQNELLFSLRWQKREKRKQIQREKNRKSVRFTKTHKKTQGVTTI